MFWRGWYQKSYMKSVTPGSDSQRPTTEKSRASSTAKPPGALPSLSPSIEIGDDVAGHAVHGVRCAEPGLLLDLLGLDHVLDPRCARVGHVEQVDAGGTEPGHDQGVALQLGMAGRRAGVPTEVVQLVAGVGHVGPPDDLAVARGLGIDIDDRDEVRLVDAGALIQSRHVDELLGGLLTSRLHGRITGAGVDVLAVI